MYDMHRFFSAKGFSNANEAAWADICIAAKIFIGDGHANMKKS